VGNKIMEELNCLWCNKSNTFIDGKCNFCKGDLNLSYNINIISTLIVGIVFLVSAAIVYAQTALSYSSILGSIMGLIAFGCFYVTYYFIKRKKTVIIISEKNTRLKQKELELKAIEEKEIAKRKEKQEKLKIKKEQDKNKE